MLEALSHEFWDGIPEFSETPIRLTLRQLLFLYTYIFLRGILIYAKFFFCSHVSNSLKTPEDDSGSPNLASAAKIRRSPPIRCLRVCHKMSSCWIAVGVIPFSSQPIRMLHSDRSLNDSLYKFEKHMVDWFHSFPSVCIRIRDCLCQSNLEMFLSTSLNT